MTSRDNGEIGGSDNGLESRTGQGSAYAALSAANQVKPTDENQTGSRRGGVTAAAVGTGPNWPAQREAAGPQFNREVFTFAVALTLALTVYALVGGSV